MKQTQGIITYDAFDSQESFEKASESIFLDITDKSREDMKDYRNVPHIFKTYLFQSTTELPTNIFELFNGIATNPDFKLMNDNAGIFGLMQSWYYGESLDACLYPQDLILPKVKY